MTGDLHYRDVYVDLVVTSPASGATTTTPTATGSPSSASSPWPWPPVEALVRAPHRARCHHLPLIAVPYPFDGELRRFRPVTPHVKGLAWDPVSSSPEE